ncbi:unnamed protein product [Strongylus vulgaris]|uniref:Uncharacterized protein n=1 Tax=Strongylus vulgaris TaxID=40348 RepID=A0A3P7LQB7_STRVU|nr:unnamed protein product [Strongylus vulgaris]
MMMMSISIITRRVGRKRVALAICAIHGGDTIARNRSVKLPVTLQCWLDSQKLVGYAPYPKLKRIKGSIAAKVIDWG